jgi:phosphohistidine phosphatase
MRRLILTRHAKSAPAEAGQRDIDRPLSKRGRFSAGLIGGWLEAKGFRPELALVSSARRTQETWSGIVSKLGAAPTTYVPELYLAGPEAMLQVVRDAPDAGCLLVLGHNPGSGVLASRLLAAPRDDAVFAKFPTGATVVVDFDIAAWSELAWGAGKLVDFVVPRSLE